MDRSKKAINHPADPHRNLLPVGEVMQDNDQPSEVPDQLGEVRILRAWTCWLVPHPLTAVRSHPSSLCLFRLTRSFCCPRLCGPEKPWRLSPAGPRAAASPLAFCSTCLVLFE